MLINYIFHIVEDNNELFLGLKDDQFIACLSRLVSDLPEHHRSTLHYLMAHFCRICQFQHKRGCKEPPTILVQVLCHIFLRPPWERIM